MFTIGIPTSRAAALVVSNDLLTRDQFSNGNIRKERAAVVLRLAPSWFRIGSFELLARDGETDLLKHLSDFVIENYFPELAATADNRYDSFSFCKHYSCYCSLCLPPCEVNAAYL